MLCAALCTVFIFPILIRMPSLHASQLIHLVKIVPTEGQTVSLVHVCSAEGSRIQNRIAPHGIEVLLTKQIYDPVGVRYV